MHVHYHSSGFFQQQRCSLENWNSHSYCHEKDINPQSQKSGIRCYHFLTSLVLRIFGLIHIEKTADGKSVYLNKKSFNEWKKWRNFDATPISSSSTKTGKAVEQVFPPKVEVKEPSEVDKKKPGLMDVREPSLIEKEEVGVKLNKAAQDFIQKISEECSPEISEAWKALLSNIPPEAIKEFKPDKNNQYTLIFSRPVTLWLNSRSRSGKQSYPKGGTILLLGHNKDNTLTFNTHKKNLSMKFNTGMNFWCSTEVGVRLVDVVKIATNLNDDQIDLTAGCKLGWGFASYFASQTNQHSIENFQKVWKTATLLDENDDYKDYLNKKIASEFG